MTTATERQATAALRGARVNHADLDGSLSVGHLCAGLLVLEEVDHLGHRAWIRSAHRPGRAT